MVMQILIKSLIRSSLILFIRYLSVRCTYCYIVDSSYILGFFVFTNISIIQINQPTKRHIFKSFTSKSAHCVLAECSFSPVFCSFYLQIIVNYKVRFEMKTARRRRVCAIAQNVTVQNMQTVGFRLSQQPPFHTAYVSDWGHLSQENRDKD